jgi:hypothetical protein
MGPIGCPETSVRNYHYSLRFDTEERSSQLLRGGSLKSRKYMFQLRYVRITSNMLSANADEDYNSTLKALILRERINGVECNNISSLHTVFKYKILNDTLKKFILNLNFLILRAKFVRRLFLDIFDNNESVRALVQTQPLTYISL